MSFDNTTIHYCWFGGNPLPGSARRCIESWRRHFPGWEIKEWNESNYDLNAILYTRQAASRGKWAFVSDYARFDILYREGGVYFEVVVAFNNPGTLTAEMEASATLTADDGSYLYPYEGAKTQYYDSRTLTTKAGGPLVRSNLLNYANVKAGDTLLVMGSESLDEQIATAQAALNEAQANIDALNAAAPIDGTILSCTIAEGSEVKAGDAVITIQNTTTMVVTIQVDDRNIGFIKLREVISLSEYSFSIVRLCPPCPDQVKIAAVRRKPWIITVFPGCIFFIIYFSYAAFSKIIPCSPCKITDHIRQLLY